MSEDQTTSTPRPPEASPEPGPLSPAPPVRPKRKPRSMLLPPVRVNRAILEAQFPQEYIKQGLNATKAYKALKKEAKLTTASTESSKLLDKPHIRGEILRLMSEQGLSVTRVLNIHKRNLEQSENLSVSQTAVQDAYKLAGLLGNNEKQGASVSISFNLEK